MQRWKNFTCYCKKRSLKFFLENFTLLKAFRVELLLNNEVDRTINKYATLYAACARFDQSKASRWRVPDRKDASIYMCVCTVPVR